MRNIVEKIKAHFSRSAIHSENHTIYEIMWKNMIETERSRDNTVWRRKDVICMRDNQGANADKQYVNITYC